MNKIKVGLITGLAIAVFGWFYPTMLWDIFKWSIGGLFVVCMFMGLFDNDDKKPYQKDGEGSTYHTAQKKQWKGGK